MYVNTGRWSKTYTCMLTQVGGVKPIHVCEGYELCIEQNELLC